LAFPPRLAALLGLPCRVLPGWAGPPIPGVLGPALGAAGLLWPCALAADGLWASDTLIGIASRSAKEIGVARRFLGLKGIGGLVFMRGLPCART
jgi:hypothetical protein